MQTKHINRLSLTLRYHQIKKKLIRSLKELYNKNRNVYKKITYIDISRINLRFLWLYIPISKKKDNIVLAIKYADSGNIVILFDTNLNQFQYSIFNILIQKLPNKNIKQFIYKILTFLSTKFFIYYIKNVLNNKFNKILEINNKLQQLCKTKTKIRRINTIY